MIRFGGHQTADIGQDRRAGRYMELCPELLNLSIACRRRIRGDAVINHMDFGGRDADLLGVKLLDLIADDANLRRSQTQQPVDYLMAPSFPDIDVVFGNDDGDAGDYGREPSPDIGAPKMRMDKSDLIVFYDLSYFSDDRKIYAHFFMQRENLDAGFLKLDGKRAFVIQTADKDVKTVLV